MALQRLYLIRGASLDEKRAPSPLRGERWGEGVTEFRQVLTPHPARIRVPTSPYGRV